MARNQVTVSCTESAWTQLTNGDVTVITFQVLSGSAYVRFTTDETTPTESEGILYKKGEGEVAKAISDLTNLASANRVWVKGASNMGAGVYVDHA